MEQSRRWTPAPVEAAVEKCPCHCVTWLPRTLGGGTNDSEKSTVKSKVADRKSPRGRAATGGERRCRQKEASAAWRDETGRQNENETHLPSCVSAGPLPLANCDFVFLSCDAFFFFGGRWMKARRGRRIYRLFSHLSASGVPSCCVALLLGEYIYCSRRTRTRKGHAGSF